MNNNATLIKSIEWLTRNIAHINQVGVMKIGIAAVSKIYLFRTGCETFNLMQYF